MDIFITPNVGRWDAVLRIAACGALMANIFIQPSATTAALALAMPYLFFTAFASWDPLYGLVRLLFTRRFSNRSAAGMPGTAHYAG